MPTVQHTTDTATHPDPYDAMSAAFKQRQEDWEYNLVQSYRRTSGRLVAGCAWIVIGLVVAAIIFLAVVKL